MSHAFGLRNDITRPVEKAEEETKTPAVPTAISGFDRDKLPEKKPGAFNTKPFRRHKVPVVCLGLFNQTVSKMSLFGKIFGSNSKGGKAATPQEAIQKLRETEEMLAKKQDFLEKKIEQELITAKKNGTKNKRAALQALKRKKRYEKQLTQIDGTLSTIEFQREALENANTNTEVLKNMGFAAKAMKAAHENMDIDKVDDLMAEITEQQEVAQEISDVISRPVGFGEDYDEDELLAELEDLEQEELDRNLLEVRGAEDVPLPSVPSTSLPSKPAKKKQEEDEDDMADLEAWAAN